MPSHQDTIIVTGVGGGIGSGWLHAHLQSPQALSHYTIYTVHPSAPGSLEAILAREAPAGHAYEIVALDLASLAAIQAFVAAVGARVDAGELGPIALLLLVAGNMFLDPVAGDGRTFTVDGLESSFAVNYVAVYVLVRGLVGEGVGGKGWMSREKARIVVVGSSSHDPSVKSNSGAYHKPYMHIFLREEAQVEAMLRGKEVFERGDEFPAAVRRYGGSKLFLTMFMYEMHQRFQANPALQHIRFLAYDPGIVGGTKLTDSMPWYIRMVMQYVLVPIQTVCVYFWPGGILRTTGVAGSDLQWCCWDESVKGGEYWDGRVKGTSSAESLESEKWRWVVEGTERVVALIEGGRLGGER